MATQVDPVLTDYSPAEIAGAFVAAYQQLTGNDPPNGGVWLFPTAQSVVSEGWQGNYAYNNNPGNLAHWGSGDWYYNPHVTDGTKFASYATLTDGAKAVLENLRYHGGSLAAAEAGDIDGYCGGLVGWYLGTSATQAQYDAYCSRLKTGVAKYADLQPENAPAYTPGSSSSYAKGASTAGTVLVVSAYAAAAYFGYRWLYRSGTLRRALAG